MSAVVGSTGPSLSAARRLDMRGRRVLLGLVEQELEEVDTYLLGHLRGTTHHMRELGKREEADMLAVDVTEVFDKSYCKAQGIRIIPPPADLADDDSDSKCRLVFLETKYQAQWGDIQWKMQSLSANLCEVLKAKELCFLSAKEYRVLNV